MPRKTIVIAPYLMECSEVVVVVGFGKDHDLESDLHCYCKLHGRGKPHMATFSSF
jgi:hypothetical protein